MRGRAPALLFGLLHPTRSTSAASPWCLQGRSLAAAADSTRLPATARLTPGNAFSLTKCFSAQDVAGFTGLTGDSNPIHSDAGAAAAAGLPAPILPGMLLASLFPAIIGSHFPGAIYLSQTLNFKQYALVSGPPQAAAAAVAVAGQLSALQCDIQWAFSQW